MRSMKCNHILTQSVRVIAVTHEFSFYLPCSIRTTHQITRLRNGVAATSTQVFYERVNRPGVCGSFAYGACGVKDISKTLPDFAQWPAWRVRVTKGKAYDQR